MAPASTSSYQHKRGLQTALDGAALGLTAEHLDDLFIAAAQVTL